MHLVLSTSALKTPKFDNIKTCNKTAKLPIKPSIVYFSIHILFDNCIPNSLITVLIASLYARTSSQLIANKYNWTLFSYNCKISELKFFSMLECSKKSCGARQLHVEQWQSADCLVIQFTIGLSSYTCYNCM